MSIRQFLSRWLAPGHEPVAAASDDRTGSSGGEGSARQVVDNTKRLLLSQVDATARGAVAHLPALHVAARAGDVAVVETLLAAGADLGERDARDGWTALHYAAMMGHEAVVGLLLRRGAAPNARGTNGWTPIHTAAVLGVGARTAACKRIVEILIEHGGDLEAKDGTGFAPLMSTVSITSNVEMLKHLLQLGARMDAREPTEGRSPLHLAAEKTPDVVVALLAAGADPNLKDSASGITPLHVAAQEPDTGIVELLIQHGAVVNAPTGAGATPLHFAASNDSLSAVRLLAHGADVNVSDSRGATPLHAAAAAGHLRIIQLILLSRPDVNATNRSTALAIARKRGHEEIVRLLTSNSPRR